MTAWRQERFRQGDVSLPVVLAMLLPLLLGLLPPLTPTAAFTLERDLAASRCLQPNDAEPDRQHHDHAQCCVLCRTAPDVAAAGDEPAGITTPQREARRIDFGAARFISREAARTAFLARGPPAV